jgi:hypothetical protein
MSAFIVDKADVDLLVTAASAYAIRWSNGYSFGEATAPTRTTVGRMLWETNLAAVAHRYPSNTSGERPGPINLTDDDIHAYTWTCRGPTDPRTVEKVAGRYDYQACELPDYEQSEAVRFLTELVRAVRGYEDEQMEVMGR